MKITNLTKYYGTKKIYENFNLEVEEGSSLAILGASGSGKTTLLNILAGLTDYQGDVITTSKKVSVVFQTDRLIPNLTVEENLKLVCPEADALSALKKVGLENDSKLYPKQLSGGMARRVALLRAFIYESNLMLLDEPFRNLDVALKLRLIEMYKTLRENDKSRTCILVTHDISEALELCDRVVILSDGAIIYDEKVTSDRQTQLKIITDLLLKTVE